MKTLNKKEEVFYGILLISAFVTGMISIGLTQEKSLYSFTGNVIVFFPIVLLITVFTTLIVGIFRLFSYKLNENKREYVVLTFVIGQLLVAPVSILAIGNSIALLSLLYWSTLGNTLATIGYAFLLPVLAFLLYQNLRQIVLYLWINPYSKRLATLSLAAFCLFPVLALTEKFETNVFWATLVGILFYILAIAAYFKQKPPRWRPESQ